MTLREFGRNEPKDLVFDENVTPNSCHLHLVALPLPLKGEPQALLTGIMLPNGTEQPVLHMMFLAPTVERSMGGQ